MWCWRFPVLVLVALVAAVFQAAPAGAAPPLAYPPLAYPPLAYPPLAYPPVYPPSIGTLSVSATVVPVGAVVQVWGDGFAPNSVVALSSRVVLPITTSTAAHRRVVDCTGTGRLCVVRADFGGRMTASLRLTRRGTTAIVASGTDARASARVLGAVVLVVAVVHGGNMRLASGAVPVDSGFTEPTGGQAAAAGRQATPTGTPPLLPASLAVATVLVVGAAAAATRRRRRSAGR